MIYFYLIKASGERIVTDGPKPLMFFDSTRKYYFSYACYR